ncbi:MAG TPA: hypothetical protein DCS39_06080 [Rhodobiaceae bacterium]|nr:hypothetical protein [Rhodobiaceae bacterium]
MTKLTAYLIALATVLSLPSKAQAQSLRFATDSQAPLMLEAGEMIWQRQESQAQLRDKARLNQGPLDLSANRLEIKFATDGTAQLIRAEGQVALHSRGDNKSTPRRATADRAVVNLAEETILLNGNVVMQAEDDHAAQLSGGQLVLDIVSGRARLSGTADKPRARIELR